MVFCIVILCTASIGLNGMQYYGPLGPVYSSIAAASFGLMFIFVWTAIEFIAKERYFCPQASAMLDILLLCFFLSVSTAMAVNDFVDNCDYVQERVEDFRNAVANANASSNLKPVVMPSAISQALHDAYDNSNIPDCDLLKTATAFMYLNSIMFIISLAHDIYNLENMLRNELSPYTGGEGNSTTTATITTTGGRRTGDVDYATTKGGGETTDNYVVTTTPQGA